EREDPVQTILKLTDGVGVDRAIDAVGIDAVHPHGGPAAQQAKSKAAEFAAEVGKIAPRQNPSGDNWKPGAAPSQVLYWATQALDKAGTLSIIGVYSENSTTFPIGEAMNKNLTLKMGNCPHRAYLPHLVDLVASGVFDPAGILTQTEPLTDAIDAYKAFDRREPGWMKVELRAAAQRKAA
ncbi:MAG TPA: glutathione-dependent formaldehyde dehydrogenase, partial [Burkholderiales bacterium]|nr:glutathione-dependent formaldehyde dehydrogenase [Burkholderiales bacterium]